MTNQPAEPILLLSPTGLRILTPDGRPPINLSKERTLELAHAILTAYKQA